MRIWPRLVAIAVLSLPFARWLSARQLARMEHYRTLDREALLAAIQGQHTGSPGLAYAGSFLVLALCFFAVHGVAVLIERVAGAARVERD
jgi:hypothetical protein